MRNTLLCIVLILLMGGLFAQEAEDWLWGAPVEDDAPEEETRIKENDFIQVHYQKKDARLAMAMSMLVPGAGQFYADKNSFTTYLFPTLELALIAGNIVFNARGNKKARDYERYANGEKIDYIRGDGTPISIYRYDRERQHRVELILADLNPQDIYESSYFRLDDTNTQHFYEDIGKYPHYVFGWADWYYHFATDASGVDADPIWFPSGHGDNPGWIWSGNFPLWDDSELGYFTHTHIDNKTHASSAMRKNYVQMRNKAKADHAVARGFTFGLAFNHIAAGLDAIRVTNQVNTRRMSDSGLRLNYYASLRENRLTPNLALSWKF